MRLRNERIELWALGIPEEVPDDAVLVPHSLYQSQLDRRLGQ